MTCHKGKGQPKPRWLVRKKTSVAQKSGSAGTEIGSKKKNRALAEKEKPLRCPKWRVIHFLFVWGGVAGWLGGWVNRWLDMIQYSKDSQNCVQVVTTTVTTTTESAWSVEVVGNKLQLPGDLQLQNRSICFSIYLQDRRMLLENRKSLTWCHFYWNSCDIVSFSNEWSMQIRHPVYQDSNCGRREWSSTQITLDSKNSN